MSPMNSPVVPFPFCFILCHVFNEYIIYMLWFNIHIATMYLVNTGLMLTDWAVDHWKGIYPLVAVFF